MEGFHSYFIRASKQFYRARRTALIFNTRKKKATDYSIYE